MGNNNALFSIFRSSFLDNKLVDWFFPEGILGNSYFLLRHISGQQLVEVCTAALLLLITFVTLRLFFRTLCHLSEQTTLLCLTPPAVTKKSSYSSEQLFSLIHSLEDQRTFIQKLIGYQKNFSLEIVSTSDLGIRYLIRLPKEDAGILKRNLLSYLPEMSIEKSVEYLKLTERDFHIRFINLKLFSHFAYPLKRQDDLDKHDPIAYITGMMTKLRPGEVVALQVNISPAYNSEVKKISSLILANGDVLNYLNFNSTLIRRSINLFAKVIYFIFSIPFEVISEINSQGAGLRSGVLRTFPQVNKVKSVSEQELVNSIRDKISQPLFETSIRLYLSVHTEKDLNERSRGLRASFSVYDNRHQSLTSVKSFNFKLPEHLAAYKMLDRFGGAFSKSLLSVSEVSDIYHFPYSGVTKTEDLVKIHSKELPAPLSLKKISQLGVVFAKNTYAGSTTLIGLTDEERRRHVYILGATGTGKSTLLLSMVNEDIKNNKGLCVIDPHGDLIEKILSCLPRNRLKDVIYFNPDDISYPVGINLLELSEGLSEEDSLREKEFIAESIISLFHKLYSDKYSGPRMEYILRNTIYTAFTIPNRTIFTVYKLLINPVYRKSVTSMLSDDNLKDFWKYEFGKVGEYQKVSMISPITNKIGRFLFSPTSKRILEQEKSTVDFDEIMDSGKILLCNLSKGRIGEDNSEVLGIVLLTKIQLAALRRARVDIKLRRDFYLYVDEFQNFATPAFAQILSEARKYRLNAILAHQTTAQIEDKSLINVTLANTGSIICFRTASPEDEKLILPQFQPDVLPGEIANLASFHFYMKINAIEPSEAFSGETIPFPLAEDQKLIESIVNNSRSVYATHNDYKFSSKPFREGTGVKDSEYTAVGLR